MSSPEHSFAIQLFARWADMDFNQHMRNAAYLGAAEDCRMKFMAAKGFPAAELQRRMVGPVVLEDKLTYKKELRLLDGYRVEIELAASTKDGRRLKIRNAMYRDSDNALAATVESIVIWFDLSARKIIVPPEDLREVWFALPRTNDFVYFDDAPKA